VLNFIELHYDNTGIAVVININKIISYERVPGRSYTDLLLERKRRSAPTLWSAS
jgi:hypothetical protein